MQGLSELERITGYTFRDKELLKTALTHSSYAAEKGMGYTNNNERLEFIGDAYVDAVVGTRLYEIMGSAHEGSLSRFRADVVCESTLSEAAKEIDLGRFLLLGKGEDACEGRKKPSILSDAFEALMGAIMLDGGFEACRDVILSILGSRIEHAANGELNRDYKTKIQEMVQDRDKSARIEYRLASESGPDHKKVFETELIINNKICGKGNGTSKARAEQAAAKDALSKGVF